MKPQTNNASNPQRQQENKQAIAAFVYKWNLSMKQTAAVLDVEYQTVRRWFSEERHPNSGYVLAAKLTDRLWELEGKPEKILC